MEEKDKDLSCETTNLWEMWQKCKEYQEKITAIENRKRSGLKLKTYN